MITVLDRERLDSILIRGKTAENILKKQDDDPVLAEMALRTLLEDDLPAMVEELKRLYGFEEPIRVQ